MLSALAVANYRSLRDVVVPLRQLSVVTGANGSGKSNPYRALRLLADTAQGRVVQSLARDKGPQVPDALAAGWGERFPRRRGVCHPAGRRILRASASWENVLIAMFWFFRPPLRHPLYPSLRAAPAASAFGHPQAVSGTFRELAQAALHRVAPRRAVFVLQHEGDPLLTDAQRDELWEKFRVPAYVLLLDADQKVCAFECEAHQGLHLPRDAGARRIPQGIETAPCGCGRPGPHLPYRHSPQPRLAVAG